MFKSKIVVLISSITYIDTFLGQKATTDSFFYAFLTYKRLNLILFQN